MNKKIAFVRSAYFNIIMLERYSPLKSTYTIKFYTNTFKCDDCVPLNSHNNIFLRLFGLNYYSPSLYTELSRFNPDLVNTIELYNYHSYISVKWARKKNKKSVIFCWETLPDHPVFKKTPFRRYFTKYNIKNATAFHVATQKAKYCLLKLGVDENKIIMQKFGVNTKRFKPKKNVSLRKKYNLTKPTILFVGRTTWEKGIHLLLKAFKNIKNANLLIVGDGDLRDYVISYAKKNKNIIYIGKQPFSEIHNIFNCADIFCLPSIPHKLWEEQFGEVLPQAMASGLPIITTNSGAIPEIVSKNEGFLVTPLSVNELEESIKLLLEDDSLRKKLSKNCRKRALKEYDYIKTNKLLIEKYKKMKLI